MQLEIKYLGNEEMQKKIDAYFDKLTDFIGKLPLSEKGKNYIWYDSFIKFYDTLVEAEDGSLTEGIQTKWQLDRFIQQFKHNFQKLRLKAMDYYSKQLEELPKTEAVYKIKKSLYLLRKKEIFAQIGGEATNEWEKWLKNFLANELDYHNEKNEVAKNVENIYNINKIDKADFH